MSASEMPANPYRPPQSFGSSTSDNSLRRRPGGLTAICVIAIILGGLGLAASVVGLGSMAAKSWINNAFLIKPQKDGKVDKALEAQMEMQTKMNQVTDRYTGFTLGFALLNVVIAGSLVTGGILTLKLHPNGRKLLIAAFTTAIFFELLRAIMNVCMQLEMSEVMYDSMSRMMQAAAAPGKGGGPEGAAITAAAMKIGVYIGLGITLVMVLAKLIYYAIGTQYLQRPNVRELLRRNTADGA